MQSPLNNEIVTDLHLLKQRRLQVYSVNYRPISHFQECKRHILLKFHTTQEKMEKYTSIFYLSAHIWHLVVKDFKSTFWIKIAIKHPCRTIAREI